MRDYAEKRGWAVAVEVQDVGSGATTRPQRETLIEAARRREIDCVLVWRLDRWERSLALASSRPSSWARLSVRSNGSTRVYVLSCARPRAELTSRTIRSGAGKTSLSVRNRSRARRKRTFGASCSRPVRACQASSSSKSRDRSIEKPRCSRTSVKCCEARLLASSVGLNLVRADLELVRDKAGGRSRSCAQIARNEAEVAKCTKLKREPQAGSFWRRQC